MSKSTIYTANPSAQNVAVNGLINLGNVIRRYGCNLNLSGEAIQLSGTGYYDVDASFTLAPTAAGNVTITAYKDGVAIPGATASETVAAANDLVNLSLTFVAREMCQCCEGISSLTFVLTGTAASITNVAVDVNKL